MAITSPTNIAGLQYWFDASDIAAADGSSITTWSDKSGNTKNATQSTTSKKPTLKTSQLGGKSMILFDGVDDLLNYDGSLFAGIQYTLFVVEKIPTNKNSNFIMSGTGATNANLQLGWLLTDFFQVDHFGDELNVSSGIASITTGEILTVQWGTAAGKMYQNGTLKYSDTTARGTLASYPGAKLGEKGGSYFTGYIGEIIVYNSVLSATDRQSVQDYLDVKWGFVAGGPLTGSASLTGVGTLTASGTMAMVGAASLQGVGTLSTTGKVTISGSATLQGVGTLTASGTATSTNITGSASLQGVGTLQANGGPVLTITGSATLQGIGTLTASGTDGVAVISTVTLQGKRMLYADLMGLFDLNVNLYGMRELNVTLRGGLPVTAEGQNFPMRSGNTKKINIPVYDTDGARVNLTGAVINWILIGNNANVTKSTGSGITITDAVNGMVQVLLSASDTAGWPEGSYEHEAKVTDALSNVSTVTTGQIYIKPSKV